ncbi:MAG: sugar phosphate isomerase/epimerase family protein [Candidatus Micrarchaeia archaeon]
MSFGFGMLCFENIDPSIKYCRSSGIPHMEIDLTRVPLHEVERLTPLLVSSGLGISFHLPWKGTFNPAECKQKDIEYAKRAALTLMAVNGTHLTMHLGHFVSGDRASHLKNAACFVRSVLEQKGEFALAIENTKPNSSVSEKNRLGGELSDFDVLFAEISDPRLRVCFDTGHAAFSWDIYSSFKHLSDRICAMHIHDNDGKNDHIAIGAGQINWKRLVGQMEAANICGPMIFEVFDRPTHESVRQFESFMGHKKSI